MLSKNFEKRIFELQARTHKTLSHPKRLAIVGLLCYQKEMKVSEIARKLGLTKANTSQHLAILRQQNIVKTRREGVTILYSIFHPKILVACNILKKVLKDQLKKNSQLVEKLK